MSLSALQPVVGLGLLYDRINVSVSSLYDPCDVVIDFGFPAGPLVMFSDAKKIDNTEIFRSL